MCILPAAPADYVIRSVFWFYFSFFLRVSVLLSFLFVFVFFTCTLCTILIINKNKYRIFIVSYLIVPVGVKGQDGGCWTMTSSWTWSVVTVRVDNRDVDEPPSCTASTIYRELLILTTPRSLRPDTYRGLFQPVCLTNPSHLGPPSARLIDCGWDRML